MVKGFLFVFFIACASVTAQEISEVEIQNNKKTRTQFIRKITEVTEKTPLDSLQLQEDIKRLRRLPGIAHAYFTVDEKDDGTYKVVYGIEENFTIIFTVATD